MSRSSTQGFTLIETIVTVALTALVLLAINSLVIYFYRTNAYALEQSQAVASARRSLENALRDLREASYGADGSYPIAATATSSVTFFANINSDPAIEKVRYYLSGSTLYRGTTEPAGSTPSYTGQPEVTTLVVDNIRNGTTPMFSYYDANGNQLTDPINISDVASVHIEVLTDVNPTRAPNVYTLMGRATLRNLHNTNTQ